MHVFPCLLLWPLAQPLSQVWRVYFSPIPHAARPWVCFRSVAKPWPHHPDSHQHARLAHEKQFVAFLAALCILPCTHLCVCVPHLEATHQRKPSHQACPRGTNLRTTKRWVCESPQDVGGQSLIFRLVCDSANDSFAAVATGLQSTIKRRRGIVDAPGWGEG